MHVWPHCRWRSLNSLNSFRVSQSESGNKTGAPGGAPTNFCPFQSKLQSCHSKSSTSRGVYIHLIRPIKWVFFFFSSYELTVRSPCLQQEAVINSPKDTVWSYKYQTPPCEWTRMFSTVVEFTMGSGCPVLELERLMRTNKGIYMIYLWTSPS